MYLCASDADTLFNPILRMNICSTTGIILCGNTKPFVRCTVQCTRFKYVVSLFYNFFLCVPGQRHEMSIITIISRSHWRSLNIMLSNRMRLNLNILPEKYFQEVCHDLNDLYCNYPMDVLSNYVYIRSLLPPPPPNMGHGQRTNRM